MKPTICGEEIPDWLYKELLIRFGEPLNVNHVFRFLVDDYIARNNPDAKRQWDEPMTRNAEFWDPSINAPSHSTEVISPLGVLKSMGGRRTDHVVEALVPVVLELVAMTRRV